MQINRSLRSLTVNLIDYAGLFPPASLNLEDAFSKYVHYLNGNFSDMLAKFICPITLFPELGNLISETHSNKSEMVISALGRNGGDIDVFKKYLNEDLTVWKNFNSSLKKEVKINSFEVKIPAEVIASHDSRNIALFLDNISDEIRGQISQPLIIFIEGNLGNDWKSNTSSLINGIEIHNQKSFDTGFKLRTGGTEANTFPSSQQIAFCIRECLDRTVPMKFTAGLHHPFPKYDSKIGATMHGFINVFGAGVIAIRHDISDTGMEEILNDNYSSNFIFTDEYFSWKEWKVEIADIDYARKNLVLSYGSCSFEEPVQDLISMNFV